MVRGIYERLRETARSIATGLPTPAFYGRHASALDRSSAALRDDRLILACRAHLDESRLECAHGLSHCEAVARDAGAIVLVEGQRNGIGPDALEPLFTAAIIAGLLHDIKRREPDHAVLGSIEADRILAIVGMDGRRREYIAYAIRNHEAFKTTCDLDSEEGCLVSNALYDADKFRWGPENFTATLWTLVTSRETPPAQLHQVFPEKMKGIERIKQTFRTETGKQYGPEIIDQGLAIGNAIFAEMTALLQDGC